MRLINRCIALGGRFIVNDMSPERLALRSPSNADRLLVAGEQPGLMQELGFAYASSGDMDLAIATLERNLRRYPDFFLSHFSLGQIYCGKRRDAENGRAHLDAFVDAARSAGKSPAQGVDLEHLIQEAQQLRASCAS